MKVIFYTEKGVEINSTEVNTINYKISDKTRDSINFELYFYNKNFLDTFSNVERLYLLLLEINRIKIGFERQDDEITFRYINEDIFVIDEINLRIENNYIVLDIKIVSTGTNRDWREQRA